MMIDMQSISLEIEYQILFDGWPYVPPTPPVAGPVLAPAANILHSAFASVDCYVGNMRITKPHFLYGYQAYIEDVFLTPKVYKDAALTNACFFPDKAGEFDVIRFKKYN